MPGIYWVYSMVTYITSDVPASGTLPHPISKFSSILKTVFFDIEVFNNEGFFDIECCTFDIDITSFDIEVAKKPLISKQL
jgi:hypothetical protein